MKIVINPGHGGRDSGAVGYNLREADVVYQIGIELTKLLKAAGHKVQCFQYDGLEEICEYSNNYGAGLFISLHCNAFDGNARGTETYYYPGSTRGKSYAERVQSAVVKQLGTVNRGIKTANFYVLRYTNCPAILHETAFIDNYSDNQLLKLRWREFAQAIAKGLP